MPHISGRRPSASLVTSIVALIIAASGTAVAASPLVSGDKLIKKHSLSGNRLRNHTLTGTQINLNKLGVVPTATKAGSATNAAHADSATNATHADSATHATSADNAGTLNGNTVRWALVDASGTIVSQSGGFTVTFHSSGVVIVKSTSKIAGHAVVVSPAVAGDAGSRGTTIAGPCGTGPEGYDCAAAEPAANDGFHALIASWDPTNTSNQPHPFYLMIY